MPQRKGSILKKTLSYLSISFAGALFLPIALASEVQTAQDARLSGGSQIIVTDTSHRETAITIDNHDSAPAKGVEPIQLLIGEDKRDYIHSFGTSPGETDCLERHGRLEPVKRGPLDDNPDEGTLTIGGACKGEPLNC